MEETIYNSLDNYHDDNYSFKWINCKGGNPKTPSKIQTFLNHRVQEKTNRRRCASEMDRKLQPSSRKVSVILQDTKAHLTILSPSRRKFWMKNYVSFSETFIFSSRFNFVFCTVSKICQKRFSCRWSICRKLIYFCLGAYVPTYNYLILMYVNSNCYIIIVAWILEKFRYLPEILWLNIWQLDMKGA